MILKDAGKMIDYAFNAQSFIDTHAKRITDHYLHAREKHPYFCDRLTPNWAKSNIKGLVTRTLESRRAFIKARKADGILMWADLMDCEVWEAFDALVRGDKAHAVEELYDVIAVLLRTIDVLEGRQQLGNPQTISGNSAGKQHTTKENQ